MKAILVIDMPKSCDKCPVFNSDFYTCQLVFGELYEEAIKGIRHENCPLKPLPQKEDDLRYLDSYAKGYNDCIDEILGGSDD